MAHGSAEEAAAYVARYRWLILLGLITAAMMEVLDTTIVNVALPQMAGNLGATHEEIGWVSTGYILSNVVVLPMTAFFTERFGRQRYLVFSIGLFVVSSFFCGTSNSLIELVIWRILQGAGGAALLSTAQATLRQIFPAEQQSMVQSIFLLGVIVAPTLGPTLGGWITDNYQWHWCFFINVPIGIGSMFLVATFLKDPPDQRRRGGEVDWLGISLLTIGVGSLQYVLEQGNSKDWFSNAWITRLAVLSGLSLCSLLVWELSPSNRHPVIDLHVLRNRDLSASLFLFVALGFALYGGTFMYPLFTQTILNFTPTKTGMSLMPGGIATACTALLCGRLMAGGRIDPRALISVGVVLIVTAMWRLGHLSTLSGDDDVRIALVVRGAALGMLFAPINYVAFGSLRPSDAQQAAGLINLSRQLGGSFGIAVLATYVATHTQIHRVDLIGMVDPYNPIVQQRLNGLTANLAARGYPSTSAREAALRILDGQVTRQAAMLSYNDAWRLLLITFLVAAPAILLLRKPRPRPLGPAPAAH